VRLGVTATDIRDDGDAVQVGFSDGTTGRYDIVVGADGVYSDTRNAIMPDAPQPEFTGQSVWRYNFPRPADLDALHVYNGPTGIGLVPISRELMYMYVTTPEPGNPFYPKAGLAAAMRTKLANAAPQIRSMAEQITDDDGVVYRPLETIMLDGPCHRGRVVLLGDSVSATKPPFGLGAGREVVGDADQSTPPHLGQGAGMAVEDGIVLAEELERHATPDAAFEAYEERRLERCRYIVERSLAICNGQLGKGPPVDNARATAEMFERVAQPI